MRRFEFTVPGPPVSAQADRKKLQEWKAIVRASARAKWNRRRRRRPVTFKVRLTVVYYHDQDDVRIDEDNMLKPIQDALARVVYADDNLVSDGSAHKRNRYGSFVVLDLSPVALIGFRSEREFLHIVVEKAPNPSRPVR